MHLLRCVTVSHVLISPAAWQRVIVSTISESHYELGLVPCVYTTITNDVLRLEEGVLVTLATMLAIKDETGEDTYCQ